MRLVWRLLLLLKRAHESPPRNHTRLDLGQMDLHHQTLLPSIDVADFRDAITWPTDLEEDLALHILLRRRNHELGILRVTSSTTSKVGLMLLALSVGEVGAFIGVKSKTKSTFKGTEMVAQDIGILGVR